MIRTILRRLLAWQPRRPYRVFAVIGIVCLSPYVILIVADAR